MIKRRRRLVRPVVPRPPQGPLINWWEDPEVKQWIEAWWKTLPITIRDPDLLTDKKY
jgi:hypothetical protein